MIKESIRNILSISVFVQLRTLESFLTENKNVNYSRNRV